MFKRVTLQHERHLAKVTLLRVSATVAPAFEHVGPLFNVVFTCTLVRSHTKTQEEEKKASTEEEKKARAGEEKKARAEEEKKARAEEKKRKRVRKKKRKRV